MRGSSINLFSSRAHFFWHFSFKNSIHWNLFWWRRRWQIHSKRCCFWVNVTWNEFTWLTIKNSYRIVREKISICTMYMYTCTWSNFRFAEFRRAFLFFIVSCNESRDFSPSARQWRSGHQSHNTQREKETQHLICNPSKNGKTAFNFAIFGKLWSFCVNIRKTICAILTHRVTSTPNEKEKKK